MSDAMNLPPLPKPFDSWNIEDGVRSVFTDDQMRAYGKACAAAEKERCAQLCESLRDKISDPLLIGEAAHHAGMNALANAADAIRARGET